MCTSAIHRVIEQHSARRGDSIALVHGDRSLTYRDLNQRANARARQLIAHGFRRGSLAVVRMEHSLELAVTLLAVLKAGGAYSWLEGDEGGSWPAGVSIVLDEGGDQQRCLAVDIAGDGPMHSAPNLPIVTRVSDVACVLRDQNGMPSILVPHETITALHVQPIPAHTRWGAEPGALDLWLALMAGSTAVLVADAVESAAA